MNMSIKDIRKVAPSLSDEEVEAQVFRELEAAQLAALARDDGIVVLQYPDNRSLFRRLRVWWNRRQQRPIPLTAPCDSGSASEPEWPRHWATTKYI